MLFPCGLCDCCVKGQVDSTVRAVIFSTYCDVQEEWRSGELEEWPCVFAFKIRQQSATKTKREKAM